MSASGGNERTMALTFSASSRGWTTLRWLEADDAQVVPLALDLSLIPGTFVNLEHRSAEVPQSAWGLPLWQQIAAPLGWRSPMQPSSPWLPARRLYEHQRVGVEFLCRQGGGLLADQMGLGKTTTAIVSVSLIILFKLDKTQMIFKYFKVYTLNGLLLCFILQFCFYPRAIRYFGFSSLSFLWSIYRCKIMNFCYSFVLFSTCIDICILLERISLFNKKYEKYLRIFSQKPYSILLVCLIFSIGINIPIVLTGDMRTESEFKEAILNDTKDKTFTYCSRTNFALLTIGKMLTFLISFFRDFLIFVIEVVLTLVSLYYLRNFFNKKTIILNSSGSQDKQRKINIQTIVNRTNNQIGNEKSLSSTNIQNDTHLKF